MNMQPWHLPHRISAPGPWPILAGDGAYRTHIRVGAKAVTATLPRPGAGTAAGIWAGMGPLRPDWRRAA